MKIEFSGCIVLVIVFIVGIGLVIVQGLVSVGVWVVFNGCSIDSVECVCWYLFVVVLGVDVFGIVVDFFDVVGVDMLLVGLLKIDILVNNVGIFGLEDFFQIDDVIWECYWQINVMFGVCLLCVLLLVMVDVGWGCVLFILFELVCNILVDMIYYGVSKIVQLLLLCGLVKCVVGSGVIVNVVLFGLILFDGFVVMFEDECWCSGKLLEQIGCEFVMVYWLFLVIQCIVMVEEVVNMVVYLVLLQVLVIFGVVLCVDGGVVDDIV